VRSVGILDLELQEEFLVVDNNDVLVVEQTTGRVTVIYQNNGLQKATLAQVAGLNHALVVHEGYLYASTSTNVYRWKYNVGDRSNLGTGQIVINNVPCCHHVTRSLAFDNRAQLYVQSGSGSNVDPDSTHARINRFNITGATFPIAWSKGSLFADGLRNEVGIGWDHQGRLFGVENGVDDLYRADLGGDIHNDNPAEELNYFPEPGGKFYGYPYCWSQYKLNNTKPAGTQWVQPDFQNDGIHSDAWCQNTNNVVPPVWPFAAHMAPLDILFYYSDPNYNFYNIKDYTGVNKPVTGHVGGRTLFPTSYNGAFVAMHGSWDRTPAQGYRVDHVTLDGNGLPTASDKFFYYQGPGETGNGWHRPVGLALINTVNCPFGQCLLITSDSTGVIIAVGYYS